MMTAALVRDMQQNGQSGGNRRGVAEGGSWLELGTGRRMQAVWSSAVQGCDALPWVLCKSRCFALVKVVCKD